MVVTTGEGLALMELNTRSLSGPGDFKSPGTEENEKRFSAADRVPPSSREDTEEEWSLPATERPVGGLVRPPGG